MNQKVKKKTQKHIWGEEVQSIASVIGNVRKNKVIE